MISTTEGEKIGKKGLTNHPKIDYASQYDPGFAGNRRGFGLSVTTDIADLASLGLHPRQFYHSS
jgi:hypothetical protein